MNDPYSVLGISPDASDEEVKSAYRSLARKYHPDNYQNNPLADLAEEKMKAINAAYDAICKQREGRQTGGTYSSTYQSSGTGYRTGQDPVFARIRTLINSGDLTQAEQLLDGIGERSAEWYFLRGCVAQRKGWLDEAMQNFQQACRLDPLNQEYRQALTLLQRSGQSSQNYSVSRSGCCSPDCCTALLCLDCMTPGCGCC